MPVPPPWALGIAWAIAVAGFAWYRRPAPARMRALAHPGRAPSAAECRRRLSPMSRRRAVGAHPARVGPEPVSQAPIGLVERMGAWLLGRARRSSTRQSARRLGWAIVAGAVFVPVLPAAGPPAALIVWAAPGVRARRAERRRLVSIACDLPDVVDLLVLGVGAGLTVQLAVGQVAARAGGPLAGELAAVLEEVALGRRFADALDDLPSRAGESVRPLVGALLASERYGAPLVAGLERLSDEVRRDRRRRAEEAARKIPVKLLFPLVTCTLPAFGLLTVAPLIASAVRSLRL